MVIEFTLLGGLKLSLVYNGFVYDCVGFFANELYAVLVTVIFLERWQINEVRIKTFIKI